MTNQSNSSQPKLRRDRLQDSLDGLAAQHPESPQAKQLADDLRAKGQQSKESTIEKLRKDQP